MKIETNNKRLLMHALVEYVGVVLRTDLRNVGLLEAMNNRGERWMVREGVQKWRVQKKDTELVYTLIQPNGVTAQLFTRRMLHKGQVVYTKYLKERYLLP